MFLMFILNTAAMSAAVLTFLVLTFYLFGSTFSVKR